MIIPAFPVCALYIYLGVQLMCCSSNNTVQSCTSIYIGTMLLSMYVISKSISV